MEPAALITNDAIVLGLLMAILGFVFWGSSRERGFWKSFYTYVPSLLVCYFLPSLLSTAGIISGEESNLYFVASRYLLPTSLVLLTLSIDFKGIIGLGPKAIALFFIGTLGIVIGGPLASPIGRSLVGKQAGDEVAITTPSGSKRFEVLGLETAHDRGKAS